MYLRKKDPCTKESRSNRAFGINPVAYKISLRKSEVRRQEQHAKENERTKGKKGKEKFI